MLTGGGVCGVWEQLPRLSMHKLKKKEKKEK